MKAENSLSSEAKSPPELQCWPVTPDRWVDLETLFGEHGACAGCWCMWWRLKGSQWEAQRGEANRLTMKGIVESGEVPGLLAYSGERPVGWCSVAPREAFPRLERSRSLKRIDDEPVWSVVCFFMAKDFRGRGVMSLLLRAAAEYAREQGGRILEAYPNRPSRRVADAWVYMGLASAFLKAGFQEVARPSEARSIVRLAL